MGEPWMSSVQRWQQDDRGWQTSCGGAVPANMAQSRPLPVHLLMVRTECARSNTNDDADSHQDVPNHHFAAFFSPHLYDLI